jgi:hypothetical protein
MSMLRLLTAAMVLLAIPALAQNTSQTTLRGIIEGVSADGTTLDVKARDGAPAKIRLSPKTNISLVVPANLNEVKPGAYIGVAAQPDTDGVLKAMEVHVFPEAMRGAGEGFRAFDLSPRSSMTNGSLSARVDALKGETLIVTYAGGSQTIRLEQGTPIVGFALGARADLKPSAAIIARGPRAPDGTIDAARIMVGNDGLVPPM